MPTIPRSAICSPSALDGPELCRRCSWASPAARLGSAYAAVTDDGAVLGVAIWLPPGRYPWSVRRQLRGAGWMLRVLRAAPGSFRAFMKTGANGARLHPTYRHWYLRDDGS